VDLLEDAAAVDRAEEAVAGASAAGLPRHPPGAPADGAVDHNLLFRWLVGLSMDVPVWDATTRSKNRDRPDAGDVAARFLQAAGGRCH